MESTLVPVACLLLLAGFIAVILHPILTARDTWLRPTNLARTRIELTEQKEQLYSSIRELEFDHSLGKISDADFETLRLDLEGQAVDALRHLDSLQDTAAPGEADLDARIEADLQATVAAAPAPTPVAATTQPGPVATPAPANFCPSCGVARQATHKFCPGCGNAFDDIRTT